MIYFLDSSNVFVASADAYATVQDVDDFLSNISGAERWNILDTAKKENWIVSVSRRLNKNPNCLGDLTDDTQPLNFPRENVGSVLMFGVAQQRFSLSQYVCYQIEFELTKLPIGLISVDQDGESFTDRQQTICREAKMSVERFFR